MPRPKLSMRKYIKRDFSEAIVTRMKREKVTQKMLGKELGVCQQAAGVKIRQMTMSYDDLVTLFHVVDFSDEEIVKFMRGGYEKCGQA